MKHNQLKKINFDIHNKCQEDVEIHEFFVTSNGN